MPILLTLRIWDVFFIEGKAVLYKIILGIFKVNEKELLKSDYEKIYTLVKEYLNETNKPYSANKAESS